MKNTHARHARRTEMSNFETAKYRMKQGFRELGLVALIGIANIAAFAFIIAMIFVLLRTLIRIS